MLNSFQEGVLIICCVNMIAVLGMSVLTGFTRLFSFGNAGSCPPCLCSCDLQCRIPYAVCGIHSDRGSGSREQYLMYWEV